MNTKIDAVQNAATQIPVRILYVEDSEDDVAIVLRQLRRMGFDPIYTRVDTPSSMRQALESGSWDIILSDFTMPRFNGRAALTVRNELARHIPFIAVSGTIGEETAVDAMKNGMNDYVLKGTLARLAPAIRRELIEASVRQAQHESEVELAKTRERLAMAVKATNDVIYDWNMKTNLVWYSEIATRRFGCPGAEVERTWWTARVHPSDRARVEAGIADAVNERMPTWSSEYRLQRANEEWAYVLDRSYIQYDTQGHPNRWIGSILDLSDFRPQERQFIQDQKMEAVSQLAGGIAHEYNNILTAIIGYSDLVMGRLSPSDTVYRDVKMIRDAGERAATLTRQVLNFSRRQTTLPIPMNFNLCIGDTSATLQRLLGAHIHLVLILEPELGQVRFDPFQVEQILVNLCANARDAMTQGGTVTIKTSNVELNGEEALSKTGLRPGPHVLLSFTDTGCGMDARVQEHIFEPFFTTKEVGKGTGLGLSSVYGIVKQNSGHVEFESTVGKGSTFRIYLPRMREERGARQQAVVADHPTGWETVLVVEDDEQILELVSRVLRRQGYNVIEARNGMEALSAIAKHKGTIHLLLTDLVMPTMGGIDLAKRVESSHPETRIVVMSGYNDQDHHGRDFMAKPVTPEQLLQKVREALEPSRKAS